MKKIALFWVMPALAGVIFSASYTLTRRTIYFLQNSQEASNQGNISKASSKNKVIKNKKQFTRAYNSQNQIMPSTIVEKETIKNPPVTSMVNKTDEENFVSQPSKKSKKSNLVIANDLMKDSNLSNPSTTSYQNVLPYQHERIIEDLFQTLPEP